MHISLLRYKKNQNMKKISAFVSSLILCFSSLTHAQQWVPAVNGTIGSNISTLFTTADKIYAASSSSGVYVTNSNNIDWHDMNNNIGSSLINAVHLVDTVLLAGSYGNGVYRSADNGDTWTQTDTGFLQSSVYVNVFNHLGNRLFVGNYDGCYISTDTGSHWSAILGLSIQIIYAIEVSGNAVYVGSSYGMKKSTDSGATFVEINNGLPGEGIRSITTSGNRVLCSVYQHHVYASDDGGANWFQSSTGIPNNADVWSLFADGNTVYAGTDNMGIYRSTDNGATWSDFSFGQSLGIVTCFCKSNGIVYAGTDVAGIFKLDTASGIESVASPAFQLYPNPANNDLFISGNLKDVHEIKIFDAIGRCMKVCSPKGLTSEKISVQELPAGFYTAILDDVAIPFEKY